MTTPIGANWSGTYEFTAADLRIARSVEQLQELVSGARRVRALGTRHSFNDLADTTGTLVTLVDPDLDAAPVIDSDRMTVTVASGTRYGVLADWLQREGYGLHNMGSLPHISVAGAIATATHGSGNQNGNLATAVAGLEMVTGTGELLAVDRSHPEFAGMVVGLGALGVVTRVTLDIQPTYDLRQDVFTGLAWDVLLADVEAVTSSAYSVSLFTDWLGDTVQSLWLKTRVHDLGDASMPDEVFGAARVLTQLRSIADGDDNMTPMDGTPGPWSERLPHFRLDSTPSNGDEIQTEFLVHRGQAAPALEAVRRLGSAIAPHLHITELRTVAPDELWLSTAYDRPSLCIHFTWKNEPDAVGALIPRVEQALAPFAPRPHWGKQFSLTAEAVTPLYPRFADFARLAERLDPQRRFRNAYLDRVLGLPL